MDLRRMLRSACKPAFCSCCTFGQPLLGAGRHQGARRVQVEQRFAASQKSCGFAEGYVPGLHESESLLVLGPVLTVPVACVSRHQNLIPGSAESTWLLSCKFCHGWS